MTKEMHVCVGRRYNNFTEIAWVLFLADGFIKRSFSIDNDFVSARLETTETATVRKIVHN
jgi:hypothetical protein